MNADGTGKIMLADASVPFWLPDGTRIGFVKRGQVHVINADGTGEVNLRTEAPGHTLAWSPDGTRIAGVTKSDIWVVRADGSEKVNLTRRGRNEYPIWSPDGSRIAFRSDRDDRDPDDCCNDGIFVMRADGSGVVI